MTELASHGGCWWEGCKICNTPDNPYPISWKGKETKMNQNDPYLEDLREKLNFDINTLKELTLNTEQAIWLLNRDFTRDEQWLDSESGDSYQENLDLKIQIAVANAGEVRISTWE